MVDAVDSKSTGGNLVGVRVSPPAPELKAKQYSIVQDSIRNPLKRRVFYYFSVQWNPGKYDTIQEDLVYIAVYKIDSKDIELFCIPFILLYLVRLVYLATEISERRPIYAID